MRSLTALNENFQKIIKFICLFCLFCQTSLFAQEMPPSPSQGRPVKIPAVKEKKFSNGLTVVIVERKNVPLVTVSLLIKKGASAEKANDAGLANMTATLLTQGTKTRTATQIAEQIEFLGAAIENEADWNSSKVTINAAADKVEKAMEIMSDVVLNPTFAQKEIALFKKQQLDNLSVSLKQPGTLASYVAGRFSFNEHSPAGTPESVNKITRQKIVKYYRENYSPDNSVLIFSGDISEIKALALAKRFFGNWKSSFVEVPLIPPSVTVGAVSDLERKPAETGIVNKILVIDLPDSGQAAVNYVKKLGFGREFDDGIYYPASVLNSVLGGGYSSRLNQEIRIKRGLSYGAGSNLGWRSSESNFLAVAQTKNESAAEVAELMKSEIERLVNAQVSKSELEPRKAVLTGGFGRSLETNRGIANRISELYLFGLSPKEMDSYADGVRDVTDNQIQKFASENLKKGDIIIVGDAKLFINDLKKRFPGQAILIIPAKELDLNRDDLRKPTVKK